MRDGVTSLYRYCTENNLTTLLSEYAQDNVYPSDEIGFKSTIECKWVCAHGHIEFESPYKRVRRGYCKTCGKDCSGSFGQKYPELVKYWSKDNPMTAYEVSPRYSKPILWTCECGHTWERTIQKQLATSSICPECKSNDNALITHRPELIDEWDEEANGIPFETVSFMSNTQYHWRCAEGHSFTASPAERVRRNKGCTICKSVAKQYPHIALEWHPTRNTITAEEVTPNSNKEVWFVCRNCGNEYISKVVDRVRRKGHKCQYCR